MGLQGNVGLVMPGVIFKNVGVVDWETKARNRALENSYEGSLGWPQ